MGIEAAIIGSTIAGGAAVVGANKQASAATEAGKVSMQQYAQTRADLAPWRAVGGAAAYELGSLAGLPVNYPTSPQGDVIDTTARDVSHIGNFGRGGDTRMAHVSPGEVVVPQQVAQRPEVRNQLMQGFLREGMRPERYTVGTPANSINPLTGQPEYFAEDDRGGWRDTDYGRNSGPPGRGGDRDRRNVPPGGAPQAPQPQQSPLPEDYYSQENAIDRFYESPEYTIPFDEGLRRLDASAASRGGLFSGNQMSAVTRYGQDYAANQYNNYWNHLYGLSSSGQNAAAQTGKFGMNAADQYGNAMYYGGNAAADMGVGINNAIVGGLGNYYYYQGVK